MEHLAWIMPWRMIKGKGRDMGETAMILSIMALTMALVGFGLATVALSATIRVGRQPPPGVEQRHSERLHELEEQMKMFFRLIETSLSSRLHAPTHQELDTLLHKLECDTISLAEVRTLYQLIQDRGNELVVEGIERPDLQFPRLLTFWTLESRLRLAGESIHRPAPVGGEDAPRAT